MFSIKLASIFLFALLGFVQPALAARTLVACAIAGIPADNFIIGSNAECQDSCAAQMNLYSLYQPSTQKCACNNVGPPTFYIQTNTRNYVCASPTAISVTRLVGSFNYIGCRSAGTLVQPSQYVGGSLENIFKTCAAYKYVQIFKNPNSGSQLYGYCYTDITDLGTSGDCAYYSLFTHSAEAQASGLSRKRRQVGERDAAARDNQNLMEAIPIDTRWEGRQREQGTEMSPDDMEAEHLLAIAQTLCPMGLSACAVPSVDAAEAGYECIDVETELESCGGCLHGLYQGPNIQWTANGTDCSALANVGLSGVTCRAGQCLVSACDDGFTLTDGQCL